MEERVARLERQIDDFAILLRGNVERLGRLESDAQASKELRSQLLKQNSAEHNTHAAALKKIEETIYGNGQEGLTTKVEGLTTGVNDVKGKVSDVGSDVATIKTDMSGMQATVKNLKWTLTAAVSIAGVVTAIVIKVLF